MTTETLTPVQGLVNALRMYQTSAVPDLKGKGADMRSLAAAIRKFVPTASAEDKDALREQLSGGRGNIVEGIWRELASAIEPQATKAPASPTAVDRYQSLMDKLGVLQSQVEVLTTLVQGMAKTKAKDKDKTTAKV